MYDIIDACVLFLWCVSFHFGLPLTVLEKKTAVKFITVSAQTKA